MSTSFYELNDLDLSRVSVNLGQALAMLSHTYERASFVGFKRMTEDEQKNYLWAIHRALESASKALGRISERGRFDSADQAAAHERGAQS